MRSGLARPSQSRRQRNRVQSHRKALEMAYTDPRIKSARIHVYSKRLYQVNHFQPEAEQGNKAIGEAICYVKYGGLRSGW